MEPSDQQENFNLIDKTIFDTPKPQACSTAERKSYRLPRTLLTRNLDLINHSTSSDVESKMSAASSLGLLTIDDLEDIGDYKPTNTKPSLDKSAVNEKLQTQRLLAQKVIERANQQQKQSLSYLFKPDAIFEPSEISARSSLFDSRTSAGKPSKSSLHDTMQTNNDRNSETKTTVSSEWNLGKMSSDSLFAKLQNELFTPAELAQDRLLADEISWRQKHDVLPNIDDKNQDSSRWSNLENREITIQSMTGEKLSIDEYFRKNTENLSKLDFKTSPEKENQPVPLIEITQSSLGRDTDLSSDFSANKLGFSTFNELTFGQDPEEFLNYLLNRKKQGKPCLEKSEGTNEANSTLKNIDVSVSQNSLHKSHFQTPEVQALNSSLKNVSLTSDPEKFTGKPIMNLSDENKSNVKSTRRSPGKIQKSVLKDSSNIMEKSDKWIDAESKNSKDFSSGGSCTLSNSPSRTCSELEFSGNDDENMNCDDSREWIHIEVDSKQHFCCLEIPTTAEICVSTLPNMWLQLRVTLRSLKYEGTVVSDIEKIVKLKVQSDVVVKPATQERLQVKIIPLVPGMISLVFDIEAKNVTDKTQRKYEHTLVLQSALPDIVPNMQHLDFDLMPENCIKNIKFEIHNKSDFELPVLCTIVQDHQVFGFNSARWVDGTVDPKLLITLSANKITQIPIEMIAPSLTDIGCESNVAKLNGKLLIYLYKTTKLLQTIDIVGKIGLAKLQFPTKYVPLKLYPGESKTLLVRNAGVVDLELHISILNEDGKIDNSFITNKSVISIKPEATGSIEVAFTPEMKYSTTLKRIITFSHPGGTSFSSTLEGLVSPGFLPKSKTPTPSTTSKSPSPRIVNRIKSPLNRPTSQASDSGTMMSFQGGRLPIESTRIEITWGTVKIGKNVNKDFVIRNRSTHRLRFQASVVGIGFKICKDQIETVSSMALVLQGLESRTISVVFSPAVKGAAHSKIIFSPAENDSLYTKKQTIPVFGYGGHCSVDVQKVTKDTNGKMWLSFGPLKHKNMLQQTFVIRNSGNLAAFAYLKVVCKELYSSVESKIQISPNEVVIQPNKEVRITVSFIPKHENFKHLQSVNVSELATVQITGGSEPTRGRIRSICGQTNETNLVIPNMSLLKKLCKPYAGEQMPSDISGFRENMEAIKELLHDFETYEITLTAERDLEHSDLPFASEQDTTVKFHSLYSETINYSLQSTDKSPTDLNKHRSRDDFCKIDKTSLVLTPPFILEETVLISSTHSRPMPFKVAVSPENGLKVSPKVGIIPPGDSCVIAVNCNKNYPISRFDVYNVQIFIENVVMNVEVRIIAVQAKQSRI